MLKTMKDAVQEMLTVMAEPQQEDTTLHDFYQRAHDTCCELGRPDLAHRVCLGLLASAISGQIPAGYSGSVIEGAKALMERTR